jgi:hypothetical protein
MRKALQSLHIMQVCKAFPILGQSFLVYLSALYGTIFSKALR